MKNSLTEVITEEDFLKLGQESSQDFLKIYHFLKKEQKARNRRFYTYLIQESEELETFLDDHCARENKTWYYFSELVACIRNFAKAAFILKHIINRCVSYDLNEEELAQFLDDAKAAMAFLEESIIALYDEVRQEASELGIKFPRGTIREHFFGDIYPQKRLPYTLDEEEDLSSQETVAKIATQYLNAIVRLENYGWNCGKQHKDDLRKAVPEKVDEEKSRELIALIHNLQSNYDHYVKHTPLESQDEGLRRFRGYITMPLHLLAIVNWITHLYQRHIQTTDQGKFKKRIAGVVNESKILDTAVNFALFYANKYLQQGQHLAAKILKTYVEVESWEVKVPAKLGFHLRPASLIVKLARHYGTSLSLIVDGREYDASNVLSITMAAGLISRKGLDKVVFKGDQRVLKDLKLLSEYNYGEDEVGNPTALPKELTYLWT